MTYLPWRSQRYDRVIKYTITGTTTMGSTCMTYYLPWRRNQRYVRVIQYTNNRHNNNGVNVHDLLALDEEQEV
jgi:hypothetical protein